jgi:hypothetical protein
LNKPNIYLLQEEISEPVMPLFEPPPQYQNPDDEDSDDDSKDPDYKDTGTFVRTYSKYDWKSTFLVFFLRSGTLIGNGNLLTLRISFI